MKEICICAAVKSADGQIFRCHRHADGIAAIAARNLKLDADIFAREGFITSRNRFVSREEGMQLQLAADIPSAAPEGYLSTDLYSEDLY